MAEAGMIGESVIEFVHRNGKGKLITQGYTEIKKDCTKVVSVDILAKTITEDIIYKDGREQEKKIFKNPVKYWTIRNKLFWKKIIRG